MAKRTASAKKQARAGVRRALRNRAVKSEIKTLVVKARKALTEKSSDATERAATSSDALKALDRAAAKGIVHRNNAARRKSRLARQLAKLAGASPTAAKTSATPKKGVAAPASKAAAGSKKK